MTARHRGLEEFCRTQVRGIWSQKHLAGDFAILSANIIAIGLQYLSSRPHFSVSILQAGQAAKRLWQQWDMIDSEGFRKTEHKVHILYSLSRSSLDQVVRYRQYYRGITLLRTMNRDAAEIRTSH